MKTTATTGKAIHRMAVDILLDFPYEDENDGLEMNEKDGCFDVLYCIVNPSTFNTYQEKLD